MSLKRTLFFAIFTAAIILGIYVFDYRAEKKINNAQTGRILNQSAAQIDHIQILKSDLKIGLQKSEFGWRLLEPLQDLADSKNIEDLLNQLTAERQISLVKQSDSDFSITELQEFGLDKPDAVFSFKNNSGQIKKISLGSVKNFEGNSYLRIDSENKIILASAAWHSIAENGLIYYREKKLYRGNLGDIVKLKVKSLRDEFELNRVDGLWRPTNPQIVLDQNKVRDVLKKISEINIVQFVYEGEPSFKLIKEKGLDAHPAYLELQTEKARWSAKLNINTNDKAFYALTERPTFLVKLDIPAWETIGNLNLDELRDRSSAMAFDQEEVEKIYYKSNNHELDILNKAGKWTSVSAGTTTPGLDAEQIKKMISYVHDLKISEFLDSAAGRKKFEGKNMLIFKTEAGKLVLQLNWGPAFKVIKPGGEKEYYYARTQLSDLTFAIEKKLIDSIEFDKIDLAKKPDVVKQHGHSAPEKSEAEID